MKSKLIAEFLGTFFLVFIGCGSIMVTQRFPGSIPVTAIPVIFGLVVAAMIYAVGHISGAHFNPAVSLGFVLSSHFPKKELLPYWAAQFIGALLAITLLWGILPPGDSFGSTLPQLPLWQALIWEVILSFLLMFVIISVATDTRAVGIMAGAAIGAAITLCAFVGGPLTGASMNPARSFAPNLFEQELSDLWIYFAGPFLGTSLAALVYPSIKCESSSSDAKGCC